MNRKWTMSYGDIELASGVPADMEQWTKTLELRGGVAMEYIAGSGSVRRFILERKGGRVYLIVALGIHDYSAGFWISLGKSDICPQKETRA